MTRLSVLRASGASLPMFVAFACASTACQSNESTSFPAGLDPIAADDVPPPAPVADAGDGGNDEYPETLSLVSGNDSADNYYYVYATGYVDASLADTWAAFKMPNVVVDRANVSSYTVTPNVETGYDVSFLTAYTIHSGIVTVEFDLTWREGAVAGTEANPTQVSVVYEKTWGSSYISMMEGSIQLVPVTPTVTELQFAQRLTTSDGSPATISNWTTELFASVVAQVHGQPLP